jgi:colicin import membrane protein
MELSSQPYLVPRGKGLGRSLVLAVAMHCLLALMLILGLSWHNSAPEVVNAELWSALPQVAAPRVEPQATPPVLPSKAVIEPKAEPLPPIKADILVKQETPQKVRELPVPPPVVAKEVPIKPVPKPEVKTAPAKPSDLAYIQQQLTQEGKGSDARNAGPAGSDTYIARLRAKIRSNTRFPTPPGLTNDPVVTLRIEQLPTGEVTSVTILTPSGLLAFDEAVQRGVEASSPLPKDEQGRVQSPITLAYHLRDAPSSK